MPITTNILYQNLSLVNRINAYKVNLENSTERLSTGKAINSAADSPSDILRISRMEAQIRGSHTAQRNIQDALSLTQVMDSTLSQMHDIGLRLKELSVQYNNSSSTAEEKSIIEKETGELLKEMKMIMTTASFGGIPVFGRESYNFQTGYSSNDNIVVENPLYNKKIETNSAEDSVSSLISANHDTANSTTVISRTYGMSVKLPEGRTLTGEIKLDLSDIEQDKDIAFSINTGNGEVSYGKLNFSDEDTASFEIHLKIKGNHGANINEKHSGVLQLNGDASRTNLTGDGTYTVEDKCGDWSGKVYFTIKSQVEDPTDPTAPSDPENPGHGEIDFDDIDKIPVKTLLSGDFIDKNILTPLVGFRAEVGIDERILEYRLSRQIQVEEDMSNALSKVQDVDVARELLVQLKNDLLLQTNIRLLAQNMDNQRDYILKLLE